MAAQETNLYNAFETTLTATAGSSDLTFTVNSVTAPTSITLAVPFYLVINPDSSTNREVVEITSINTGTKTLTCSGIGKRYLAGSAATSGLSHASGSTVRMSPVEQHIEDLNDRVDTIINEAGTAVNTSLFLDEDDMSTDSATKGVTQQSVKAYVDTKVTAEDLDTAGNAGTGAVDLDSQSLTVSGDGTILSSTASGQSITFAIADATTSAKGAASFATANFAVSSGAVTIKSGGVDLTDEVTGTLPVGNGGTGATTLTDGGVLLGSGTSAVTATAVLTNGQLLIGDGTGDPTVATLTGGTNVTVTNGAGSISIASTDTNTTYTAGDGLDLSTTTFSTDLKSNGGLVIESGELAIDLAASSITNTLDTADGGTGLSSFTAGDIVYYATGTTLTKLAKGDADDVLTMNAGATAPEWAAAGASSAGLTLISKDDFSAVGNVTKHSCFSGTYDNYKVIVDGIGLNTTYGDMRIQFTSGGDGTIDTTANMDFISVTPYHDDGSNALGSGEGDVDSAYWRLTSNNLKGPYPFTLEMDVINPYTSGKNTQATWQLTTGFDAVFYSSSAGGGQKMETTQFDGIYLNWGVANSHTCTGTIRVYGYQSTV